MPGTFLAQGLATAYKAVGVTDEYIHLQRVGQKVPEPDVIDMRWNLIRTSISTKGAWQGKWACGPGGRSQQRLGMGLDRENTQHSLHHLFQSFKYNTLF